MRSIGDQIIQAAVALALLVGVLVWVLRSLVSVAPILFVGMLALFVFRSIWGRRGL